MTKLKNLKWDETHSVKNLKNSNRAKNLKLKMGQNSKTQIVTKLKLGQMTTYEEKERIKKEFLSKNILTP